MKVTKPFNQLGDSWPEVVGTTLLLVLVGSLYLFMCCILWLWGLISLLLRFPRPKQIPQVVDSAIVDDYEVVMEIYKNEFLKFKELNATIIDNEDDEMTIKNDNAQVSLWSNSGVVGISIAKVDSGMWHTDEEGNIDLYFWIAIGALREGMIFTKSIFGNKQAWIRSKEMDIWIKCSAQKGDYSYVSYARRGPRRRIMPTVFTQTNK